MVSHHMIHTSTQSHCVLITAVVLIGLPSPPKDRKCNPSLLEIIGLNSTTPGGQDHVVQWWDAQGIVGLILFLMCVLYSR